MHVSCEECRVERSSRMRRKGGWGTVTGAGEEEVEEEGDEGCGCEEGELGGER